MCHVYRGFLAFMGFAFSCCSFPFDLDPLLEFVDSFFLARPISCFFFTVMPYH